MSTEPLSSDSNDLLHDPSLKLKQKDIAFLFEIHHKQQQCQEDIKALKAQLLELEDQIQQEETKLGLNLKPSGEAEVLEAGKKRFNESPRKGIEYLIEQGHFKEGGTAVEIARFLYEQKNLSKVQIGDYLGEHKPLNLQVLTEYLNLHEFASMEFDKALRHYLWGFRLPGESQKIDRMMEAFAKRFCVCNQSVFSNSDACYILAFATIMLNTSLHNPSVQHKPTLDEFVAMNRGIDNGNNLPREVLTHLYESIKSEPFKIPDDETGTSITFFNPEHQGFLMKEGGSNRTWKKRWIMLTNSCVYYFKQKGDETPLGIIPLVDVVAREVVEDRPARSRTLSVRGRRDGDGLYFEIVGEEKDGVPSIIKGCKINGKGVVVQGNHTRYLFKSETAEDCHLWVRCINDAVKSNPFYHLYAARVSAARDSVMPDY